MKLEWSDIAEADLDELYDYIARDVPYYAEQFVDRLIEAVNALNDNPRIGRHVPEADRNDVRELIFQGYRIIYRTQADRVHILTVLHGSRNLAAKEVKPWDAGE